MQSAAEKQDTSVSSREYFERWEILIACLCVDGNDPEERKLVKKDRDEINTGETGKRQEKQMREWRYNLAPVGVLTVNRRELDFSVLTVGKAELWMQMRLVGQIDWLGDSFFHVKFIYDSEIPIYLDRL